MNDINASDVPCNNAEESEKKMNVFIELTKYRDRVCYSIAQCHLMPEEKVYMWCWWNIPKKKKRKENSNKKGKPIVSTEFADSYFLHRADSDHWTLWNIHVSWDNTAFNSVLMAL